MEFEKERSILVDLLNENMDEKVINSFWDGNQNGLVIQLEGRYNVCIDYSILEDHGSYLDKIFRENGWYEIMKENIANNIKIIPIPPK